MELGRRRRRRVGDAVVQEEVGVGPADCGEEEEGEEHSVADTDAATISRISHDHGYLFHLFALNFGRKTSKMYATV